MHFAIAQSTEQLTHISEVIQGEKYLCEKCPSRVYITRGAVNRHHFRHYPNTPKHGSLRGETAIHKLAKDYIKLTKQIMLPNGEIVAFDNVELEVNMGGAVIDAVGYIGSARYFIEIWVHHCVDAQKRALFNEQNVTAIEINLRHWISNALHHAGSIEFARDVLFNCERRWLSKSGWPYWKQKIARRLHWLFRAKQAPTLFESHSNQGVFPF